MYKQATIVSLGLLLPILSFWIFQISFVRKSDFELLQKMFEYKEIASSYALPTTQQFRYNVCKDIWFAQEDHSQLHYRISSQSSLITLIPVKNKFEMVESLQNIRCWIQDKLFHPLESQKPMQQVRYLEANQGTYHYTNQEFQASDVMLSLFHLPGHTLSPQSLDKKQAFLKGIAENVSLVFCEKSPQFQAEKFKATMVKEE